jgi:hypothetical protein
VSNPRAKALFFRVVSVDLIGSIPVRAALISVGQAHPTLGSLRSSSSNKGSGARTKQQQQGSGAASILSRSSSSKIKKKKNSIPL